MSKAGFASRDAQLSFMKRLWKGMPTQCPKCGKADLVLLHAKAKKSLNDWKCPHCGQVYRTIRMLYSLPDR